MKKRSDAPIIPTSEFWYDLFYGGYFNPSEFIENEDDVERVKEAMTIVEDYKDWLENNGLIEEM